ncbi:MAG: phosphatase PAP2 family protein [Collinsella sp.]|nr:phosphatase PAP2 family protein [Collinsella sp.]
MDRLDERPTRVPARRLRLQLASWVRAHGGILLATGCLVVFLALMAGVVRGGALPIDEIAHRVVVERMRARWLTPVMEGFSALASPVVLIVSLMVMAAFAPGRRPGWFCALNLGLSTVLNILLKELVQRPRPEGFRLAVESGFSFPSGHSMAAMAFFGLIVWLIWRHEGDRRLRALLSAAFCIVILMVGVSRVYLGVHYASDVVGGFCASIVWLVLYTRLAAPVLLEGGRVTASSSDPR